MPIFTGKVESIPMLPGIERKNLGVTPAMMLCELTLKNGAQVMPHAHVQEQIGYIVSGRLQLTIGGEHFIIQSGDSYALEGNVIHSASALEDTVVVEIYSPHREDLKG